MGFEMGFAKYCTILLRQLAAGMGIIFGPHALIHNPGQQSNHIRIGQFKASHHYISDRDHDLDAVKRNA